MRNILVLILGILSTISIYEVGYLENDIKTVKKEENPTLRIIGDKYQKLDKNFEFLIVGKYLITIVFIYIIDNAIKQREYILLIILIQIMYVFHNRIRNRKNLITFFILSTLRYLTPLTLDYSNFEFYVTQIILSISIIRLIEKMSESKYNYEYLKAVRKNIPLIRVKYYTLLIIFNLNFLSFYFFIYRLMILLLKKSKKGFDLKW